MDEDTLRKAGKAFAVCQGSITPKAMLRLLWYGPCGELQPISLVYYS